MISMAQHRQRGRKPDHRKDAEVYLAYREGSQVVEKVAANAGLSRSGLYKLVSRVEERHPTWVAFQGEQLLDEVRRRYPTSNR